MAKFIECSQNGFTFSDPDIRSGTNNAINIKAVTGIEKDLSYNWNEPYYIIRFIGTATIEWCYRYEKDRDKQYNEILEIKD